MSFNILNPKYSETEINNNVIVRGQWKVGVVSQNGEVQYPLGDVWRDNLIQDRGLNIINGTYTSNWTTSSRLIQSTSNSTSDGIAIFLKSAYFGDSSTEPFATNKTWLNSDNNKIYWTSRLTAGAPENGVNQATDDYATGKRTFRRVWDFPSVDSGEGPITVREIAISAATGSVAAAASSALDQIKGKSYTFYTNSPIFTRFILPSELTLSDFQFLRLYYTLDITVPAISVNGTVNVNLQSGGFDATGKLRLIGQWSSIFGDSGKFFQQRNSSGGLLAPVYRYSLIPWAMIGYHGCTARFLKGNTDASQNLTMPSVGSNLNITYAQDPWFSTTTSQNVDQSTAGSTLTPAAGAVPEIVPTNNSVSREATLLFQANNPDSTVNGPIAGVLFFPEGGGQALSFLPSYTNPADTAFGGAAWYWQFTDELGNKRSVTKDPSYGLAINIRQTVAR